MDTKKGMAEPQRVLRVLVADDEPAVRSVLARLLQRRGHAVTGAATAAEALDCAATRRFDVALVDVRMPSSVRLARDLVELHGLDGRVILMTGADPIAVEALYADLPVLPKPIRFDEAVRLVEAAAGQDG